MATLATSDDFRKVTNELGPDELRHLFYNLRIPERDIEHAERSADTSDTRLKAISVLNWWKKTEGKEATHEKLLEAKRNIDKTGTVLATPGLLLLFDVYIRWSIPENRCNVYRRFPFKC